MPERIDETLPKRCTKCKEIKPPEQFSRGTIRKDGTYGLCGSCKKCRVVESNNYRKKHPEGTRRRGLKYYYKYKKKFREDPRRRFMSSLYRSKASAKKGGHLQCSASYDVIKAAFTGKCHVCGVPEIECRIRLHMDHCHETGKFRGWLCASCNKAAGLLRESSEVILNLAFYIEHARILSNE